MMAHPHRSAMLATALTCAVGVASLLPNTSQAALDHNPNQLWHMVHDACAVHATQAIYPPAPCTEVVNANHPESGYAVLKDRAGQWQYLLLPLARIPGIESPLLLKPQTPNYFAAAWTARLYVEAALHRPLPRDEIGLAINSADGRTQNQMHIHIDCLRPEVHQILAQTPANFDGQWHALSTPLPPHQRQYQAMWIHGAVLRIDPFKRLASTLMPGDSMANHSLVLVGTRSARNSEAGFVLLTNPGNSDTHDASSGEELLDHSCAIAAEGP